MKKTIRLIPFLLIIITLLTCFSACAKDNDAKETEKTIKSFTVSVPDKNFTVGSVDYSEITLILTYNDGTVSGLIPLTEDMIAKNDLYKLSIAGTQQISVTYPGSGKSEKIYLTLVEEEPTYYTVSIKGGYVHSVDGKALVSPEIPADGEWFRGEYLEGTVVTLHWKDVDGRNFLCWTANNVQVSEDSIIDVTVAGNVAYEAYDSAVDNTVSFEIGIKEGVTVDGQLVTGLKSKSTNVLYASEVETLHHDEYVFVGWTTDVITSEQAKSGYSRNLVRFPYRVSRDIVFYGVWTPRGLTYAETAGGYAVVGFDGNVRDLEIPDTFNHFDVVKISADAFSSDAGRRLTQVRLPAALKEVEEGAFRGCAHLEKITISSSESFVSDDGVLYTADRKKIVAYPAGRVAARYEVFSDTETVAAFAFSKAIVGGVVLPSRLTAVGQNAFDSVHIDFVDFYAVSPAGLRVDDELFHVNLKLIRVAENAKDGFLSLRAFGEAAQLLRDVEDTQTGVYTWVEDDGKTSKTLYRVITERNFVNTGKTAEILGVSPSVEKYVVQKVTQDDYNYPVTSIAANAFYGCDDMSLFRISTGSSLERICDDAFSETIWYATKAGDRIVANDVFYKYFGTADTVTLETSIEKIAEGAFSGNATIRYVDITSANNLRYIMAYAFYGCENLKGFVYDAKKDKNGVFLKMRVRSIGDYAFYRTAISHIVMQDENNAVKNELHTIGSYAFGYCDKLLTAQLSSHLADLSETAFVGCYSLVRYVLTDPNESFSVFDGILYERDGDGWILCAYPAGRMDAEFNPNERLNYVTGMTKNENDFNNAYLAGRVGDVYFNGVKRDLYMDVASSVNKATLSTTSDDPDGILTDGNGNPLTETTDAEYASDGTILPNGQKYFYFYDDNRRARVILYDEDEQTYYCKETLSVGKFKNYALYYSNVAAICIPESVKEIESNAVFIPGLLYVRYESSPVSTYTATIASSDPIYVITESQANLSGFYQNDQRLLNLKSRMTSPFEFFHAYDEASGSYDESVLYAYDVESEVSVKTYVVRTSRTAEEITIPDDVTMNRNGTPITVASASAKKVVYPYAFFGGLLKKVTLRCVDELKDHAFSEAYAMTSLDLNSYFIATVGTDVFGDKLNDGLYLYDPRNGIDLYYNTEKWGLEFFDYVDVFGSRQLASRYLIRSENGPFAVVMYGEGDDRETVDLLYGQISVENVEALQSSITKIGYDISTWTDFDGNVISVSEDYVIPYNIVLVCNFAPQTYTVRLSASPSITMAIDDYTTDPTGYVTYVTTVTYDAEYDFRPVSNAGEHYVFWRSEENETIEISGVWSIPCTEELSLRAVFGYKLIFDDPSVDPVFAFNGEAFACAVPAPIADSVFVGWYFLDESGSEHMLTDGLGNGLQPWGMTDKNDYYLYAKWVRE